MKHMFTMGFQVGSFFSILHPKDALGCLKAQKFKMWQYGPYNRNAKMHMLYIDHSL